MATKTRSSKVAGARSLAAHAEAAHAAKVGRLAAEGRAAIRAVRARSAQNSANYYDIGDALRTLAKDGVAEALGRADFAEICAKDLDISVTHARVRLFRSGGCCQRRRSLGRGVTSSAGFG